MIPGMMFSHVSNAHLIGIAGSGMRAMADVLLHRGWTLSGSDLSADPLPKIGVRVHRGHARGNLAEGTDLVVCSDAIDADNPELVEAIRRDIPTYTYFEMVGQLTAGSRLLAVAGTHGKSTTTAMAAELFCEARLDPTVFCGATPLGQTTGGRAGRGDVALVEACEYRANFLHLAPRQAVILGIEPDHFDCYDSIEPLEEAFVKFARSVPKNGLILARHDCPVTRRVVKGIPGRVVTFGFDRSAQWSAANLSQQKGRYSFSIEHLGRHVCEVSLRVPGRHNALNALAAAALGLENGIAPEIVSRSLSRFRGLSRRMESLGTFGGAWLLDDYAHHPTEVTAALATVRQMAAGRPVWCVFQPHQASRTERLLDELAESLQNADRVLVADIFRAREAAPRAGEVTAADLARQTRRLGAKVATIHDPDRIARSLATQLAPGDVVITIGAGNIRRVCDGIIRRFRESRAAG